MREENTGQVAHRLGVEKIELHESFDRRLAGAIGIAHPRRDLALEIEGQPVLGAAGNRVKVAAYRPQPVFGTQELGQLALGQQARLHEIGKAPHPVDIFADPEERVKIAQAALALLHIGFDDIARIAHAFVPRIALGELVGDKLARGERENLADEAFRRFVVNLAVAPDEARFQQGGADGEIVLGEAHRLIDAARRLADLEPQIPQRIEDRLDHLFGPCGALARRDESQIDVAIGRHFAAPIAANRDDREPFAGRTIAAGIEKGEREIVEQPDQLIGDEGVACGDLLPARGMGFEAAGEFFIGVDQRRFEQRHRRVAPILRFARARPDCAERIAQHAPVDQGALVGQMGETRHGANLGQPSAERKLGGLNQTDSIQRNC